MANEKIIGQTGAVTGFDTPDPKEGDPNTINTTTPADDRVGAADQGKYQPVEVPPASAVTGQFDHLATRDPVAMEHQLQRPEYEGAESTVALGGAGVTALDAVVPGSSVDVNTSVSVAQERVRGAIDPNPHYTPPSQISPPHISEQTANRPGDETTVVEHLNRDDQR